MPDARPTLLDRLADEFRAVLGHAERKQEMIEPTAEEAANGWTAEALTAYIAERAAGQSLAADPGSLQRRAGARPRWANNGYNPMRFGR